ncbi:MAG TPA: leucine--tRNA ligase [Candidatus Nanoarchaeia archaeon]|nr:leucine--tRNA ligase [Candidatus Nanoarchaeia archaeon]
MDVKAVAEKWQKKWAEAKAFEPQIDKSKKKFFFTTPYPYISGSLHIGHGRAVVESDIYVRFLRMKGFNVLYPLAFHITGTPILGISLAIASGDKKKIELYKNYVRNYVSDEKEVEKTVESFKDPWNLVNFFIPKMLSEYSSLGTSIDWSRRFTTGDLDYQKLITWQFHKYKDKNYLIKGSYPVLYCPNCENAVGEDDIQDADTNPVSKQDFIWGKFKLKDSDLILMAGTTRPDAFYGQTHIWLDPEATYKIVQVNDEKWVVGEAAVKKIEQQYAKPEVVGDIKATELIGKWAKGPLVNYDVYIVPAWFIDANVGSGIVYSALEDPVDLFELKRIHDDMKLLDQYNLDKNIVAQLKPISIIRIPGMGENLGEEIGKEFGVKSPQDKEKIELAKNELNKRVFRKGLMKENCGECAGMSVQKAQKHLKKKLIEQGEAIMFYETSRPAICRCGTPVTVAVLKDQWFLDFNAPGWKDLGRACLEKMQLVPESSRKLYLDAFEWLDKRPAARKRGIGTPLPFSKDWIIESLSDSTIYMSFYTIKNLINKYGIKSDQMSLEFFDYVYLNKGSLEEVSSKVGIAKEVLEELREAFAYWYPNDHRHTYQAHLSNHLSFFILAHAAIFPEEYWPKKISLHGFVVSEGSKMSKSKGNVITLLDVKNSFGPDTFRAYLSTATSLDGTFDWKEKDATSMNSTLLNLYNNIIEMIGKRKKGEIRTKAAKAFISRFESLVKEATGNLEEMKLRQYGNIAIHHILTNIKRMQKRVEEGEQYNIYDLIASRWVRLLTPVAPHMAEELWEMLKEKGFVSLAEWPQYDESKIDLDAEASEKCIEETVKDVRAVFELAKIQPKKVKLFVAESWKYAYMKKLKEELTKTRNLGELLKALMASDLKKYGQEITKLTPKFVNDPSKLPEIVLSQELELSRLEESKESLKEELGCDIEIEKAEDSPHPKAKQASPGKPAILVE